MAQRYRPVNQVVEKAPIDWTSITPSRTTLEKLELLTSTATVLAREGYIFAPLTDPAIWKKNRCYNCGTRLKKFTPHSYFGQTNNQTWVDNVDQGLDWLEPEYAPGQFQSATAQNQTCTFHDGRLFKGRWECCDGPSNTRGCCSNLHHVPGDLEALRADWLYHSTPAPIEPNVNSGVTYSTLNSATTPSGDPKRYKNKHMRYKSSHQNVQPHKDPRLVVALDCEMGTSVIGERVLIKVSLVDFFTLQPLIDSLVQPTVEMAHYNTRYSGVTFGMMNHAIRSRNVIKGTDAARELIYRYVDSNTIIVMHGGSSDLNALRMIHPPNRIIDTFILEGYDPLAKDNGLKKSLKDICERRCGIQVQNAKLTNGRNAGHDSLEDALGAREIVCAWLHAIPDE